MSSDRLSSELHKHGYSLTKPRQAVFQYLLSYGPVSMRELADHLPAVDRASIYRTIALFEKLGFIRRITLGWKYQLELSDTFTTHHHHLQCRDCGKVIDIVDNTAFDKTIAHLAEQYGFTETTHELEISGRCPRCSALGT